MPKIAIVDDRKDHRETLKRYIEVHLPAKWDCIDLYPLKTFEEYSALLHNEDADVAVILVDEKLHETASDSKSNVNYSGTQLATYIRKHFKEFPIYLITSFKSEIKGEKSVFEATFAREEFGSDVSTYVTRMVRAGTRYLTAFEDELSTLSDTAVRIASGRKHKGDEKKIAAIQEKLGESFSVNELSSRAEWLSSFEESIAELKTTVGKLKKKIEKKK